MSKVIFAFLIIIFSFVTFLVPSAKAVAQSCPEPDSHYDPIQQYTVIGTSCHSADDCVRQIETDPSGGPSVLTCWPKAESCNVQVLSNIPINPDINQNITLEFNTFTGSYSVVLKELSGSGTKNVGHINQGDTELDIGSIPNYSEWLVQFYSVALSGSSTLCSQKQPYQLSIAKPGSTGPSTKIQKCGAKNTGRKEDTKKNFNDCPTDTCYKTRVDLVNGLIYDCINVDNSTGNTGIDCSDPKNKSRCSEAAGQFCSAGVIKTAIGCIPTDPAKLVEALLTLAAGASGGIALLLMIFGAFRMVTSAGNAESLKAGQEQFSAAVIGLLFIIFAVLLLKIIGVDILSLPGFQ